MTRGQRAGRWAGRKLVRRIGKSVPFVGGIVTAAFLYETMKRKGAVPGLADAVLNSIPFFGALKNGIEMFTDDWIPDHELARTAGLTMDSATRGPVVVATPIGGK